MWSFRESRYGVCGSSKNTRNHPDPQLWFSGWRWTEEVEAGRCLPRHSSIHQVLLITCYYRFILFLRRYKSWDINHEAISISRKIKDPPKKNVCWCIFNFKMIYAYLLVWHTLYLQKYFFIFIFLFWKIADIMSPRTFGLGESTVE